MVLPPAQLRLQGAPASSAMRALVLWCRVANIPVELEKVVAPLGHAHKTKLSLVAADGTPDFDALLAAPYADDGKIRSDS
jgi:hypothetical protein